jgi:hypothetical protein
MVRSTAVESASNETASTPLYERAVTLSGTPATRGASGATSAICAPAR